MHVAAAVVFVVRGDSLPALVEPIEVVAI
jgi:hypothetical protein